MGNVPLRRFIDLVVDEVSLVDSPANEKEFAILKRVEEKMPDDVKEVIEKEATSSGEKLEEETVEKTETKEVVEEKTVDSEKIVNEAVEKAIGKVTNLIDSIAKKANEKNEEPAEEVAEKVEGEATEAASETPETPEVAEKTEDEVVEKAKRFTPRRVEALKQVAETIQTLVSEIVQNTTQQEEEVAKSSEKDETQVVFKSLTETLESLRAGFKTFQETTKSLSERLDVIEKSIQPSQSVESNGGTDTEVKKTSNIWKGLL